ncbi:MAG: Asp-tRNA(Asn)/Glu-tRNA(Gln) amidotransferase subunit GatC [Erysipelotrichaceae bacterium]|nr:Asp-tRNA(Asn)/Glu-tRNA(Gln) amidotransferase subunit GatC [Erysipelotrichaceae bacterium]
MKIEEIKELGRQIRFECSDEEAASIAADFDLLEKQLAFFEEIDTENVEEMVYPFDVETVFLREDVENDVLSREEVLANVSRVREGHVVVPKVVR